MKSISLKRIIITLGIPFGIIASMFLLTKSSYYENNPNPLSIGIILDLLLTMPLVYFFLIRKQNIPKITIVPFFVLGIVISSFIIPKENQFLLEQIKVWVLPLIELTIISFLIYKIRKARKYYKNNEASSLDFFTALKMSCAQIVPKQVVTPFATEIAVFYYSFFKWKRDNLKENQFSYHKNSGSRTIIIALIFIIIVETFAFHILLSKWSNIAAWIFTILSIYTAFQLYALLKSISRRPSSIENNKLNLYYGIFSETIIDISSIESIDFSSKEIDLNKETRKLSPMGSIESHNIVIRLKEENTIHGFYGLKKTYKNIAFYIDDIQKFRSQIEALQKS